MKQKILVTGAAGFLGHFLVAEFIKDHDVVCLVRPKSKNLARLSQFSDKITFIEHDIREPYHNLRKTLESVKIILHAAGNPSAESSVQNPIASVLDNTLGTAQILELAKQLDLRRFVYYSAGEIFGEVPIGVESGENDCYNSLTPYSASKAGGEELCVAYNKCFGVPVSILHVSNTFGEMCQTNRFPTIAIRKILRDELLTIHINSDQSLSGRKWMHASNVAEHTRFVIENQNLSCEKWNSSGNYYITNLELAQLIAKILKKDLRCDFLPLNRQGHQNAIMSASKLYDAGYSEKISMIDKLTATVEWYKQNQQWLT